MILSDFERRELRFALAELFFKLTRVYWARGGDLSTARFRAKEQLGFYLKTKPADNPTVQYMMGLLERYGNPIAKCIMKSSKAEFSMPEKIKNIEICDSECARVLDGIGKKIRAYDDMERLPDFHGEFNRTVNRVYGG